MSTSCINILLADDDPDDRHLMAEAYEESGLAGTLRFVEDGNDLMDCLHHRAAYADLKRAQRPDLILLDLNMPGMDGREALRELKTNPELRRIPVIALTSSQAEREVWQAYDSGVNSYITKPATVPDMVRMFQTLVKYWESVVTIPTR